MSKASFRFKSSGQAVIFEDKLTYTYSTSDSGWCGSPYIVKIDDNSDNLYELDFELSDFITTTSDKNTRTCTITGPLYILPDYEHPVTQINLKVVQESCVTPEICQDLLNEIDIQINGDLYQKNNKTYVSKDGDLVEFSIDNFEPNFDILERKITEINDDGEEVECTWAYFTDSGIISVNRRGFEDGEKERSLKIYFTFGYVGENEIDEEPCEGVYETTLYQEPRYCDEDEIDLNIAINGTNNEFTHNGGESYVNDIVTKEGYDSGSFKISNVSISPSIGSVEYSESNGYYVLVNPNNDYYDKTGILSITYSNIYRDSCNVELQTYITVHGITCQEVLSGVRFAYYIDNDETNLMYGPNIEIPGRELYLTPVLVVPKEYEDLFYFDDEEWSVLPEGRFVWVEGRNAWKVPKNQDSKSNRNYSIKISAKVKEQYSGTTIADCEIVDEVSITQLIYEEISDVGFNNVNFGSECDSIQDVPFKNIKISNNCENVHNKSSDSIELSQKCDSVVHKSSDSIELSQKCDSVVHKSSDSIELSQKCDSVAHKSSDVITFKQSCSSVLNKSSKSIELSQYCDSVSAKSIDRITLTQICDSVSTKSANNIRFTQDCPRMITNNNFKCEISCDVNLRMITNNNFKCEILCDVK